MAERRSIHRKASVSDTIAELGSEFGGWAVAFWLLLIPHYDRWGCVADSPRRLKATVVPICDEVSTADVGTWIDWLVERGDLKRVTGQSGDRGLKNPKFLIHQTGAHLHRESPSPYEPAAVTKNWTRNGKGGHMQESPGLVTDESGNSPDESAERRKEGKKRVKDSLFFPPDVDASPSSAGGPPPSASTEELLNIHEAAEAGVLTGVLADVAERSALATRQRKRTCKRPGCKKTTAIGEVCDGCLEKEAIT